MLITGLSTGEKGAAQSACTKLRRAKISISKSIAAVSTPLEIQISGESARAKKRLSLEGPSTLQKKLDLCLNFIPKACRIFL